MLKTKVAYRFLAAAALIVLGVALASETRSIDAQSQSKGATPTGTWFLSVPGGLTTFLTFHQGGTVSEVTSFGFGGPPFNRLGPVAKSTDLGIWEKQATMSRRFCSVSFMNSVPEMCCKLLEFAPF